MPPSSYLTLDTLLSLLNLPLPVAYSLPLISLAHNPTLNSPTFLITTTFAITLTLLSILSILNAHVAYGAPRKLDWADEVVVITGGANGLGRLIAETFTMRGASVAVLDVRKPEGMEGVLFVECDVGDLEAVGQARERVVMDVCSVSLICFNSNSYIVSTHATIVSIEVAKAWWVHADGEFV